MCVSAYLCVRACVFVHAPVSLYVRACAVRTCVHVCVRVHLLCACVCVCVCVHLLIGNQGLAAVAHIVANRNTEQDGLLLHQRHVPPQKRNAVRRNVLPVDEYTSP